MCEAVVLLKDDNGLNLLMMDVAAIRSVNGGVMCSDLLGGSIVLEDARVAELDMLRHRVVLKRA